MEIKEITSDELKERMDKGDNFVLIDLLGEKSYESLHVPQAVSVDPGEGFIEKVMDLVKDDLDTLVIVYAANFKDEFSTIKVQQLAAAGFSNILDFKGGLKDWAAELYPLEGARAPKRRG